MLKTLRYWFNRPFYLDKVIGYLPAKDVSVLDVGCGTHSASIIKKFLPHAKYYGLDKDTSYLISEKDLSLMEKFYEIDLNNTEALTQIPGNFFDIVFMNHVLEHIPNGEDVILNILPKVKTGGKVYIEFPSLHSDKLPSIGKGTLNFYDDPTHIRIYNYKDVSSLLNKNGFEIINHGIRRGWKRILFLPVYLLRSIISGEPIKSSHFYDITGFASFIFAKKKQL